LSWQRCPGATVGNRGRSCKCGKTTGHENADGPQGFASASARVQHVDRYGSELNLQLQARYRRFTGVLKYADYAAAATTPVAVRDTTKLWLQVDFIW